MKIIIAGAGAVGTHLARLLSRDHQDCILIDEDENRLDGLDVQYDLSHSSVVLRATMP